MYSPFLRFVLLVAVGASSVEASAQGPAILTREPTVAEVEAFEFRSAGPVVWVDDRSVAVIDRDDQNVVIVDLRSGAQRTVGRKGEGPGELSNAVLLLSDPDRGLLVGDMGLRRVSHFAGSGEFIRSQRLPGLPIGLLSWGGDRVVAAWMELGPTPSPIVGELDLVDGQVDRWYSLFEVGLHPPEEGGPFSPPLLSVIRRREGLVLAGEGREYRILGLDADGNTLISLGRPELPARLPTDQEVAAARQRISRLNADRPPPPPELARQMDESLREPRPFFGPGAFGLDAAGRLWVVTSRMVNDSSEIDVFSFVGEPLQTVRLRDRVQSVAFRGSAMAALVERQIGDIEGFQGVDIYRLR